MDIVYLHKKTKFDVIRYSLRSLKYVDFDKVWVVGDRCDWMQNIHHISFDDSETPQTNTLQKFYLIASHPDISKQCIIMHDDFILLSDYRPVLYHNGRLIDKANRSKGERAVKFARTCQYIQGARDFDMHYPLPVERADLKSMMDGCEWDKGIAPHSLYGNLQNTFPVEERNDCKTETAPDFLSTYNESEKDRDFFEQLFPQKSQFELNQ